MSVPQSVVDSFTAAAEETSSDWWPDSPNTKALIALSEGLPDFLVFLEELDSTHTDNSTTISTLQGQVGTLQSQVADLQAAVETLQGQVSGLLQPPPVP